jgi:hypothetical protein
MGAKPHIASTFSITNNETKFLELKLKKELNDKKLTPQKKYTLAILAARELKQLYYANKALEFYQIAREVKTDENKNEINQAFSKYTQFSKLFYFDVNLKSLITSKNYEKAILSLNPESLSFSENYHYRIVYDLLNVKIKKRSVKKLYCYEDYQKNPDDYQYSNLLCDLLVDYLHDGKLGNDHIKVVEEYFLKHDMSETYLIQIAKDLKNN